MNSTTKPAKRYVAQDETHLPVSAKSLFVVLRPVPCGNRGKSGSQDGLQCASIREKGGDPPDAFAESPAHSFPVSKPISSCSNIHGVRASPASSAEEFARSEPASLATVGRYGANSEKIRFGCFARISAGKIVPMSATDGAPLKMQYGDEIKVAILGDSERLVSVRSWTCQRPGMSPARHLALPQPFIAFRASNSQRVADEHP